MPPSPIASPSAGLRTEAGHGARYFRRALVSWEKRSMARINYRDRQDGYESRQLQSRTGKSPIALIITDGSVTIAPPPLKPPCPSLQHRQLHAPGLKDFELHQSPTANYPFGHL